MLSFSKLRGKSGAVAFAVVVLLTLVVFGQTVRHAFIIWDDDKNVYENPLISRYTTKGLPYFWQHPYQGLYIPVTYTVWTLLAYNSEAKVNPGAGDRPILSARNFHFGNLMLHLGSVVLVILIFHRLLGRKDLFAAAVGASLFAFHPLQVEPVAWVTGMKDVLSTFLALASMILYFRASTLLRSPGKAGALGGELDGSVPAPEGGRLLESRGFGWGLYGMSVFVYIVALLAKPQLVVIPPIIAIFEIFLRGVSWKLTVYRLIPFFVFAVAATVLTMIVQPDQDEIFPFDKPSWLLRPVVALDALAFYLSKLVYPFMLATDPGRTPMRALELAKHYPLWLAPVALTGALLCIRKHQRYYWSAAAVVLVGVGPNLGFIPFAYQGQSTVADRYVYIAMIGVGFGLAAYLRYTESRLPRYAAMALMPVLAAVAFVQVQKWETTMTLFNHGLKVNDRSVAATYNLALAYSKDDDFERALKYYHRSIELKDDFPRPWNNIGFVYNTQGRFEEAIPYLKKAIELGDKNGGAWSNLGIAYDSMGESDKAIEAYDKALEQDPRSTAVFTNMGMAYFNKEDWKKAIYYLGKASYMDPSMPQPYGGLGKAYLELGNYVEAITAFQNLVNLRPNRPQDRRYLAEAYAMNGQFDRAAQATEDAIRLLRAEENPSQEGFNVLNRELEDYRAGKYPPGIGPNYPGGPGDTEN